MSRLSGCAGITLQDLLSCFEVVVDPGDIQYFVDPGDIQYLRTIHNMALGEAMVVDPGDIQYFERRWSSIQGIYSALRGAGQRSPVS